LTKRSVVLYCSLVSGCFPGSGVLSKDDVISSKSVSMNCQRLATSRLQVFLFAALAVLLMVAVCPAAGAGIEQSEQEKARVLREVAQNWISVGVSQSSRGLYQQAEKSFLIARGYQEYLTAEEHKQLEEQLAAVRKAGVEKQAVLEHIRKARELVGRGQPIKARAHYEKVKNSPYLNKEESQQIADELKDIDRHFDKRANEITELYNRSVELYREGELEKAREGFVEVARYGLLVTPEEQSAEDYLIQIDSILTDRLTKEVVPGSSVSAVLPGRPQEKAEAEEVADSNLSYAGHDELELLQVEPAQQTPKQQQPVEQYLSGPQADADEIIALAEPFPKELVEAAPDEDARKKIIASYIKAAIEDVEVKVEDCISRGEFGRAILKLRIATETVKQNRIFIGDELFAQYSIRLKQLADGIIRAQNAQ